MSTSVTEQDFEMGVAAHRAGRLDVAAAAYERIIAAAPRHFGATQFLGVVASQQGRFERAVELIGAAIAIDPSHASAHVNLANALMGLGRDVEAEAAYTRALALVPDLPEALFGLGNALRRRDAVAAAAAYERAIVARPDFVEALANLAELRVGQGRHAAALDLWVKASKLRPAEVNLYLGAARSLAALGRADEAAAIFRAVADTPLATAEQLFDSGNALARLRRFDAAVHLFRAVLARETGAPAAVNNLANMLRELGRLDEAEQVYGEALRLDPDNVAIICNRALLLFDLGRAAEAEAECCRALAKGPSAIAEHNLGLVLYLGGQIEAALGHFQAAARLAPDVPETRFNEGVALLHLGRLAEGWPRYEARWARGRAMETMRDLGRPQWRGGNIAGKTILVHAEQGFGDTLHFARYVPLLAARGARVVFEVQPPLVRLMAGVAGVAQIVPRGQALPDFDLHSPTMSLPLAFSTSLDSIPAHVPYIHPPADAVAQWDAALAGHALPRVGLVWAGDARHYDIECAMTDRRRSLPLAAFAPVLDVAGVEFFSLQIGPAAAQAREVPRLIDLTGPIRDFADTAGLIAHLDLVISVDTAVVHLTGALGKPVWVLSRFDNCWRWMREREDSPWYPTLRLFRQTAPGAWEPVIGHVRDALADWAAKQEHETGEEGGSR